MWVIHENVPGFDENIIAETLGAHYTICNVLSEPAHFGFPVARKRVYTVCVRKGVKQFASVEDTYKAMFQRLRRVPDHWTAVAAETTQGELLVEENRMRQCRKLESLPAGSRPTVDWSYLLTECQREYLRGYRSKWEALHRNPVDALFNLGQNPTERPCHTTHEGFVPTLTHTAGKLWADQWHRWLLPSELAILMGFPCRASLAAAARCSVDACLEQYTAALLGNAMHVASVGGVMAATLASIETEADKPTSK